MFADENVNLASGRRKSEAANILQNIFPLANFFNAPDGGSSPHGEMLRRTRHLNEESNSGRERLFMAHCRSRTTGSFERWATLNAGKELGERRFGKCALNRDGNIQGLSGRTAQPAPISLAIPPTDE